MAFEQVFDGEFYCSCCNLAVFFQFFVFEQVFVFLQFLASEQVFDSEFYCSCCNLAVFLVFCLNFCKCLFCSVFVLLLQT